MEEVNENHENYVCCKAQSCVVIKASFSMYHAWIRDRVKIKI